MDNIPVRTITVTQMIEVPDFMNFVTETNTIIKNLMSCKDVAKQNIKVQKKEKLDLICQYCYNFFFPFLRLPKEILGGFRLNPISARKGVFYNGTTIMCKATLRVENYIGNEYFILAFAKENWDVLTIKIDAESAIISTVSSCSQDIAFLFQFWSVYKEIFNNFINDRIKDEIDRLNQECNDNLQILETFKNFQV